MSREQFLRSIENTLARRKASLRTPFRFVIEKSPAQRPTVFPWRTLSIATFRCGWGGAKNTHIALKSSYTISRV